VIKVPNVLQSIQLQADNSLFSRILKQDLAVGILLVIYFNFFTCLQ